MSTGRTTLRSARRHRVSFLGVIRSELLKLVSLRASVITLLMFIPVNVFFAQIGLPGARDFLTSDPVQNLAVGASNYTSMVPIGYLLAVVVSILCISGEYSTGQIGATFSAVPRRGIVLLGKATAVVVVVWTVVFVGVLVTALASLPMLSSSAPFPPFGESVLSVLSKAAGAATGSALIALIAMCIGGVLRSVAFSIAAAFGLILVLPSLMGLAPVAWLRDLAPYTPPSLAQALYGNVTEVPPLCALLILVGMTVAACAVWGIALARRDV